MNATSEVRNCYRVRQTKSGYNGDVKYLVHLLGRGRVSVHAHHTRDSAQAAADRLNVGAMVRDHHEDPRPYDVRLAEAQAVYDAWVAAGRPGERTLR